MKFNAALNENRSTFQSKRLDEDDTEDLEIGIDEYDPEIFGKIR
jgi:hypothetical protein